MVLKIEEKEQTVGGFVLAGSAQEKTKTAQVVATGQGVRTLMVTWLPQALRLATVSWLKLTQVLMSKMAMRSTSSLAKLTSWLSLKNRRRK